MSKKNKSKISSLNQVLQIGQEPELDPIYYLDGHFDQYGNYIFHEEWPYPDMLFPWEWVMIPEIVRYAEYKGVEVPENPEVDLSRTF